MNDEIDSIAEDEEDDNRPNWVTFGASKEEMFRRFLVASERLVEHIDEERIALREALETAQEHEEMLESWKDDLNDLIRKVGLQLTALNNEEHAKKTDPFLKRDIPNET